MTADVPNPTEDQRAALTRLLGREPDADPGALMWSLLKRVSALGYRRVIEEPRDFYNNQGRVSFYRLTQGACYPLHGDKWSALGRAEYRGDGLAHAVSIAASQLPEAKS